jgi:hypothetical protein
MKNYLHKILHPISTAYGCLLNFLFLKFQREIWKQEDFRFCQKKWEKKWFFQIFSFLLLFLLLFGYFEVFLLILEFLSFLFFILNILSLKINN